MHTNDRPKNEPMRVKNPLKPIWRWALVLYVVLMVISTAIRIMLPDQASPAEGQHYVMLNADETGLSTANPVKISYFERFSDAKPTQSPILLVHGSPMAAQATFSALIPILSQSRRVLAPDLPGFGASTRSLPDYSVQAHARYLLAFMDRLGIDTVHVVAYSMGGGVALNMAHLAPQRVRSISMLSAIGVQEFELLGNYHINHALHGVQLALVWSITNLVPHMGLLDKFPLNMSFARNFYDTDQRPLRGYLGAYQSPMMIVHGKNDPLVPLAAALEHHRLVPQSRLQTYQGGHLLLFRQPETVGENINRFISDVEHNRTPTRASAQPDRVLAASQPFSSSALPPAEGFALAVLMIVIALATLISEDLTCIGAGLLAARGTVGFIPAATAAFIGIFVGDILLYLAGRFLGRPALNFPPFKWLITEADLVRTSCWFNARGPAIILASRFLPGSRLPTYFGAGVLRTGFWMFALYFSIAAALWTPLLVGLATLIGQSMFSFYDTWQQYALLATLASVAFIWLMVQLIVPLFTYRGRRLLFSALVRKIRWEFWPPLLFYPPVVIYIIALGLWRRGLTLFTATNPGIPESGFVGESKSSILDSLKVDRQFIARYRLIPADFSVQSRIRAADTLMQAIDSTFPIVLKPDVGQRGSGVTIVRNRQQLESYLASAAGNTIIQEYIEGAEYGVFYYRRPGNKQGQIFSITDKRLLSLTGDGRSTLEKLILKDRRAVCMAKFHLKKHAHELDRIPAKDERIQLVEVGTHARGALFLDGISILTEPMQAAIDRISRGFEGFYFGRYDIRTPNLEDFKRGHNFKIVELNGVTSEATHIYDPGNSLWQAYRVLMRQWRIAVDIGAINRSRGAVPMKITAFLNLVFRHQFVGGTKAESAGQAQKKQNYGKETQS